MEKFNNSQLLRISDKENYFEDVSMELRCNDQENDEFTNFRKIKACIKEALLLLIVLIFRAVN